MEYWPKTIKMTCLHQKISQLKLSNYKIGFSQWFALSQKRMAGFRNRLCTATKISTCFALKSYSGIFFDEERKRLVWIWFELIDNWSSRNCLSTSLRCVSNIVVSTRCYSRRTKVLLEQALVFAISVVVPLFASLMLHSMSQLFHFVSYCSTRCSTRNSCLVTSFLD
jgi:hypothetical protein